MHRWLNDFIYFVMDNPWIQQTARRNIIDHIFILVLVTEDRENKESPMSSLLVAPKAILVGNDAMMAFGIQLFKALHMPTS